MQRLILVVLGAVLTAAAVAVWMEASPAPKRAIFANHVWVERMPREPRDRIRFLIPIRHGRKTWGAAHDSSAYSIRAEAFSFRRKDGKLHLRFLQSGNRVAVEARAWRCEGEAPKPFQLCLELRDGNRRKILYSRDDWDPREGAHGPVPVEVPDDPGYRCADCDFGGEPYVRDLLR